MILADTSIWIELLNGRLGKSVPQGLLSNLAICGPVLQEVLQGLISSRVSAAFRDAFEALENGVSVWHRDRDFRAIARYTGLDALRG